MEKGVLRRRTRGATAGASGTKRRNGKADVCFDITYKDKSGKKIWEKVGWRSEGVSQALAASVRRERMEKSPAVPWTGHPAR